MSKTIVTAAVLIPLVRGEVFRKTPMRLLARTVVAAREKRVAQDALQSTALADFMDSVLFWDMVLEGFSNEEVRTFSEEQLRDLLASYNDD